MSRGASYTEVMERRAEIVRDSIGLDYEKYATGVLAFDYEGLLAGTGYDLETSETLGEYVELGQEGEVKTWAWVTVPRERKLDPPEHHAVPDVPAFDFGGGRVRLYAGELGGHAGPAPMPTPVLVAHVALPPGGSFTAPVPEGWSAGITGMHPAILSFGFAGSLAVFVILLEDAR